MTKEVLNNELLYPLHLLPPYPHHTTDVKVNNIIEPLNLWQHLTSKVCIIIYIVPIALNIVICIGQPFIGLLVLGLG